MYRVHDSTRTRYRMEWVEIIEPRTKEHMYANLTTGECVWDPPPGVPVKKTDNNQWWELFDQNTSRFYYYNATSQKTVWHRPTDCDIIPLAKLQTLKQNTEPAGGCSDAQRGNEPRKKETVSTQTQTPSVGRSPRFNHQENPNLAATLQVGGICKPRSSAIGVDLQTSPPSPSPSTRRHHHHHHHHHSNRHHHRHHEQPTTRRHHNHSQDSGRSSDSSVSHSRTSLESTGYRLLDSPHRHHHRSAAQPQQPVPSQPSHRQHSGTLEIRSHKSGTLESAKNQKSLPSTEPPPLGLSLSTSTPLFKKKTFAEPQREIRIGNLDMEKSKNGRESNRGSYGPEPSTSPYRESMLESRAFRQEMPPYRPPEVQLSHSYKAQGDKYGSLVETGNRYHRDRERELHHRERVNSLDKTNSAAFYPSSMHPRNANKQEGAGSIGRLHHGCPASLSEANVREKYGAMLAERNEPAKSLVRGVAVLGNVSKQRSLEVSERERDRERDRERERDYRRTTACNNSLDCPPQPLARSYSFVQQQKQQQKIQQQQQQQNRRRDRDDDSMHERYLVGQTHPQSQQQVSSNTTSSNSSNSSSNSAVGDDLESNIDGDNGKKRSNGNPSPPPSPFYGNLLVDADHLLPLQHYIIQQAKLSGCYKFGDPLLVEEGDDSLDEEGGRGGGIGGRADDDSDDQFADDEAASNQGDSSSQEYLEDHYADLGNYDTAGLATYYNTADTLTRPQVTPPPPPTIVSHTEPRENLVVTRPVSLPASTAVSGTGAGIGVDTVDLDEARRDDSTGGGDIEKYAQDNLNLNCGRPKGLRLLFRKKFSVRDILSWSKDPIPQPMLVVVDGEKLLKREACNLFRLVQVYMGDRKANVGMTLDGVAMDIVNTAFTKPPLRDELYVQICRQTTENPRKESLRRGWELMAVCLAFVPPSATFEPYLEGYMNRHRDPNFQFPEVAKWPIHVQVSHYATVACRRLQRIGAHGKRQPRKATIEDIDQARIQIFRASMFGATLSEVMALQRDRFPQRELPWVQTTLTRQVLVRGGTLTEGIFRVSADADEVSALKSCLDRFEDGAILAASQDAHAPASLLKLWVRELYEPLIPDSFYTECVSMRHDDAEASAASVAALVDRLPDLNRRVLSHLVRFLQIFARPEVVARTKMDANNLAMVMAPNILRCTSQDPRVILENARKEMAFVRTLIESLDTAWVDDLH
ncbi:rho GTPase-activating protein 39 isoform X2 [Cephus cinctus]|uniref:Rho GTPase-activating protein 39 isoform X2 n=1 Tax=Cephus cinctus TaxID=211228 RepID=A0AAJ7R964_CEPCN|nr:rho GTPase-activating protein 39 isoform X2 [Cephus cinctus]XP_024936695.1 rho GTPase-activating protein 39 isoform X2 [Cephus cinctus]